MRFRNFALAGLLLISSVCTTSEAADAGLAFPPGKARIVIPLRRQRSYLFAPVRINGHEPAWFLLDTGAATSLIDKSLADQWKLSRLQIDGADAPFLGRGTTGAAKGTLVDCDEISVAGISLGRRITACFDLQRVREALRVDLPGILGSTFFREFPFTIDFVDATLTLYDPKHFSPSEMKAAQELPLRMPGETPAIRGIVGENSNAWFEIDTGDNINLALYSAFVRQNPELGLLEGGRGSIVTSSAGLSGIAAEFFNVPVNFTISGHARKNLWTMFTRHPLDGEGDNPAWAGRIGNIYLERSRMTLDYASGRAWIEWRDAGVAGNVNSKDYLGRTALYRAAAQGNEREVKALLDRHADPHIAADDQTMPLYCAFDAGSDAVAELLMEHGCHDGLALCSAARHGNLRLFKMLLQNGADPHGVTHGFHSPLHWAAIYDRPEMIEALIEAGSDPAAQPSVGGTPLWYAAGSGNIAAVTALLKHNPPLEQLASDGTTPLIAAAEGGHAEMVQLLLVSGAKVNAASSDRRTALMGAAISANPRVVRALLKGGADPRPKSVEGKTAFDIAAETNSLSARLLYTAAWRGNPQNANFDLTCVRLPPRTKDVTLHLSRGGDSLFVHASTNGEDIGWFWLNTAVAGIVIDKSIADSLHLPVAQSSAPAELISLGKRDLVALDNLKVGDILMDAPLATAADLRKISETLGVPLAGILGASFLRELPFTLDWRAATLTIHDPVAFKPPGVTAHPLRCMGDLVPCVQGVVNGVANGWFVIDTGESAAAHLCMPFTRTQPDLQVLESRRHIREVRRPGTVRNQTNYAVRMESFSALGPLIKPIDCTAAELEDDGPPYDDQIAGAVGVGFLRQCRLTVDGNAGKAWSEWLPEESKKTVLARLGGVKEIDLAGVSPLMRAADEGRADVVSTLLDQGADALVVNARGDSALRLACHRGDTSVALMLLKAGTGAKLPIDAGAMLNAVNSGNIELVKALLEVDPNAAVVAEAQSTPLHLAARANFPDLVRLLMRHGANPAAVWDDSTPVTDAAAWGSTEALTALLDGGVSPDASVEGGQTAIIAAVTHGELPALQVLLQHGASPDLRDGNGKTAMMYAAPAGNLQMVRLLLAAGADAGFRDDDGSPLDYGSDLDVLALIHPRLGAAEPQGRARRKTLGEASEAGK